MNIKRRKTSTWEDVINFLVDIDARYMIRRYKKTGFNVTQGVALLLLKPLNLPANLV